MSELAYQSGTPPQWEEGVASLTIAGEETDLAIVGPCPRCHHSISKNVASFLAPALGKTDTDTVEIRIRCNCIEGHEGSPDDAHGCGAEGTVKVRL